MSLYVPRHMFSAFMIVLPSSKVILDIGVATAFERMLGIWLLIQLDLRRHCNVISK